MAIELRAEGSARAERRSAWNVIPRLFSGAIRKFSRRTARGFFDLEEKRRFERELEARRSPFREGGPW